MTLFVVVVVLVVSPSSLAFVAAVVLTGNAQHLCDRGNFIFNDTKFFICVRPKGFIFIIIFIIYLIIVVARFIISHKEKKKEKDHRSSSSCLLLLLHNVKKIHSFIDLTPY